MIFPNPVRHRAIGRSAGSPPARVPREESSPQPDSTRVNSEEIDRKSGHLHSTGVLFEVVQLTVMALSRARGNNVASPRLANSIVQESIRTVIGLTCLVFWAIYGLGQQAVKYDFANANAELLATTSAFSTTTTDC